MSREIKFRAWDEADGIHRDTGSMSYFNGYLPANDATSVMRYTGLCDMNRLPIYEMDLLRCHYKIGDNHNHYVDAIYQVTIMDYEGLELKFIKIFGDNKDENCQYPISQRPSFLNRQLQIGIGDNDYRLAIAESYGHNPHGYNKTWRENHYSDEVEVIGNIYQNPDLFK